MAFTRPDNNVSIWRGKPDLLQDQSSTVKADFDRLLNENTDDVLTLIDELEATGDTSGSDQIGGPTGTVGDHIRSTANPHMVTAAQTGAYTSAQTDAAIDAKVVEIGAGDMAKAVYDPTGHEEDVFAYADGIVSTLEGTVTGIAEDVTTLQGEMATAQEDIVTAQDTADDALPLAGGTMEGDLEAYPSSSLTDPLVRNIVLLAVGASSSGVPNNTMIARY